MIIRKIILFIILYLLQGLICKLLVDVTNIFFQWDDLAPTILHQNAVDINEMSFIQLLGSSVIWDIIYFWPLQVIQVIVLVKCVNLLHDDLKYSGLYRMAKHILMIYMVCSIIYLPYYLFIKNTVQSNDFVHVLFMHYAPLGKSMTIYFVIGNLIFITVLFVLRTFYFKVYPSGINRNV